MKNIIKIDNITSNNYDSEGFYYINQLKNPHIKILVRTDNFSTDSVVEYNFNEDPDNWYAGAFISGTKGQRIEQCYEETGIYSVRIFPGSDTDIYSMTILEYYPPVTISSVGN